jgi:hypothetical protein
MNSRIFQRLKSVYASEYVTRIRRLARGNCREVHSSGFILGDVNEFCKEAFQ